MLRFAQVIAMILGLALLAGPAAIPARAEESATVVIAPLVPTEAAPIRARGEARLVISRRLATLTIEAENIPFAQHNVRIDGVCRARLLAMRVSDGTAGEVEFRDPLRAGFPLLNFNPLGKTIQIECGGVVYLSGVLGPPGAPGTPGIPGIPGAPGILPPAVDPPAPPQSVRARFAPSQPALRVAGSLNFKSGKSGSSLVISINNLSLSRALLLANGAPIAEWTPGKRGSKIVFSSRPKRGHLTLDFDPTGTTFEVMQNGVVVATADAGGAPMGGGARRIGDDETRLASMSATGIGANASGKARLERRPAGDRLLIEVEDLPPGPYVAIVNGAEVGTIDVRLLPVSPDDPGPTSSGAIEFATDGRAGAAPLTFDAAGALVQVAQHGRVVMGGRLP